MFNIREILAATKGKLLCGSEQMKIFGISTDSRDIQKGSLFIPIKGNSFDGHNFIDTAISRGAHASLTSKHKRSINNKPLIYVLNTLKAFHEIAKHYRKRFNIPIIGITGSSGKTTTKDMLASILSRSGKTLKTEQNLNNEIGTPQTIFKLRKDHKFAVIEIAMQGLGEIEELADIVMPDIAIITNIGSSHMKFLKKRSNIAKAKSEILKFGAFACLPADDAYFQFLNKGAKQKVVSFGINNKADVTAENIVLCGNSSFFTLKTKKYSINISLPLPGLHNIYDALAAASAAYVLDIPPLKIKKGLEVLKLSGSRTNIIKKDSITIIDDTYNANPDSMKAALLMLSHYKGRKIAVLGDMLELGPIAQQSHKELGLIAKRSNIDHLITVGKKTKLTIDSAKKHGLTNSQYAGSNKNAVKILRSLLKKNDTVLIKGSRGMHMEEIIMGIY